MGPHLDRLYRATLYEVVGPTGRFTLFVDRPSTELLAVHAAAVVVSSVYLTACNPGSQVLPDTDNAARNRALESRLQSGGWRYLAGVTVDPSGVWPGEASFLVLGLRHDAGVALANEFAQNAILVAGSDATPRLVWASTAGHSA